jgi:hypothetical protein
MTSKKEAEALNEIRDLLFQIKTENENFRNSVNEKVKQLESQVQEKHIPISLEKDILCSVQKSMDAAIASVLSGYNSPLTKLVAQVIDKHSKEIFDIIDSSFNTAISTESFKESVRSAFAHKVGRHVLSNFDGLFDKISNELRNDAKFKAKATLAMSGIIEEFLNKKDQKDLSDQNE